MVLLPDSKNGDPRTYPRRDADGQRNEVGDLIERRWKLRVYGDDDSPAVSRYVFHVNAAVQPTSDADKREALSKLTGYRAEQPKKHNVASMGKQ